MSPKLYLVMGKEEVLLTPNQPGHDAIVEGGRVVRHHRGSPVVRLPSGGAGGCL